MVKLTKINLSDSLRASFVDKQIYIRSPERTRYIYASWQAQIILFFLLIGFSFWVGFASVNIIYGDEIAETRDREMQQMRIAYEERINRLQLAYDNLNNELTLARDWFAETTNQIENRHRTLDRVLEENARVSNNLRTMQNKFGTIAANAKRRKNRTELVAHSGSAIGVALESRNDMSGIDGDMKLALIDDTTQTPAQRITPQAQIPHIDNALIERIQNLKIRQQDRLDALEEDTDTKIAAYTDLIDATRVISADEVIARLNPNDTNTAIGIGGPFVPLDLNDTASDLDKQVYRIANSLDRLLALTQSVESLPLAAPIHHHNVTSHFGPRLDPIRKRPAFHAGIDFGALTGTPIYAPLAGRVVSSGSRGPYGISIEIDHGNGFKTRYGHLNAAHVRRGDSIKFQQLIGEVGNTGRSTGSHLHYEIWLDGRVRDPAGFLDTGRQIFNAANK